MSSNYIGALDVGTTTLRFQILNSSAETVGSASTVIKLVYPKPGYFEINPDQLWDSIVETIKNGLQNANLNVNQIKCFGISTQRCTFTSWRKDNGKALHNLITWKDLRAYSLVNNWNKSLTMKLLKSGSYALYLISGSKRFLTGSRLNFSNGLVVLRLVWTLTNIPELREAINEKNALFGTLDTWLLHKFTAGRLHVTDISNASPSGIFDPFSLEWGSWAIHLFKLPKEILPEIVDNDFNFGPIDEEILGAPIPITCVMADQTSSVFGSGCLNNGDLKVTLGTGSFLNLNTSLDIHTSVCGLYPVVGWKLNNKITYLVEAACNDTGSLIQWALKIGILQNSSECSGLASKVENTDGVYFIPAFSGLGPPIYNDNAATGFLGLKPTTQKEHLVRAILESIAFRIVLAFNQLKKETNYQFQKMCVDGGVSKCDFLCQLLADMTGLEIERPSSTEMSILGVTFIAGLNAGVWKNKEEIMSLRKITTVFYPTKNVSYCEKYSNKLKEWLKAAERFKSWYI